MYFTAVYVAFSATTLKPLAFLRSFCGVTGWIILPSGSAAAMTEYGVSEALWGGGITAQKAFTINAKSQLFQRIIAPQ